MMAETVYFDRTGGDLNGEGKRTDADEDDDENCR
jgi:hypothetical protein